MHRSCYVGIVAGIILFLIEGCGSSPQRGRRVAEEQPAPASRRPKILQFYASPGIVTRGEEVTLCYGVENAERLQLTPAVAQLRPSRNRCISFIPEKSAIYTLVAYGAGGEKAEAQLAIQVQERAGPAPPSPITIFMASSTEIDRGERVTLCYGLSEAASVKLEPPLAPVDTGSRCFSVSLDRTTTFRLKATDAQGREFERELTIRVR